METFPKIILEESNMKKVFSILSLVAVSGALVVGSVINNNYESVLAEEETEITMDSSFFTNWTDDAGTFDGAGATFWDAYHFFNSLGSFYRGESKGDWKGTLTSRTWKQKTQYVYFTWSAANNTDDCTLTFHYGGLSSVMKNDTFVENPMMLRYFKIPDDDFATLIAANPEGFDMSVDLYDNLPSAGYGFHNFGYLHVNQTEEQVSDAMRFYLNSLDHDGGEWQVNKRKEIFNHYTIGNAALKEVFYRTVSNGDEDFESNSDFLKHWYFDYNYFNGGNWTLHFDRTIGTDSYRPDDATRMPFNKTGTGFFRGWFENDTLGGFVNGDNSVYRFVSRPFVLSETGIVSIKMAGTASLHVIDPATRQDLAWADCQTFNTSGSQSDLMADGFNTCTMVRHIVNLEAYVGKTIQLAIADVSAGGWGAAYFDELDTTNAAYPAFKVDAFNQTNTGGSHDIYKADKYINSTAKSGSNANGLIYVDSADINKANDNAILNHADNSVANEAYKFLENYYPVLRSAAKSFSYENADADPRNNVLNDYIALSSDARALVNASTDLKSATDVSKTIGEALPTYLGTFAQYAISFDNNGGSGSLDSISVVTGSKYNLPDCPFTAPEHKEFAGWKVGDDVTLRDPGFEITVTDDVTIAAQWSFVKFDVTYNANGGSGENHVVNNVEYGSEYRLLAPAGASISAPAGKQFKEWNTSAEGNGTHINPDQTYEITEAVTFYAIWEDTAKTIVERDVTTRSSLSYTYHKDDLGNFTFTNVALRFGGIITEDLWDQLDSESHIVGYGVLFSTDEYLGANQLKDYYETADGTNVKKISKAFDSSNHESFPALYSDSEYQGVTDDYYVWNVKKMVDEENFKTVYASIAFIVTENNGIVFLNETRKSVKTAAGDEISSGEYTAESLHGSVQYLASLA